MDSTSLCIFSFLVLCLSLVCVIISGKLFIKIIGGLGWYCLLPERMSFCLSQASGGTYITGSSQSSFKGLCFFWSIQVFGSRAAAQVKTGLFLLHPWVWYLVSQGPCSVQALDSSCCLFSPPRPSQVRPGLLAATPRTVQMFLGEIQGWLQWISRFFWISQHSNSSLSYLVSDAFKQVFLISHILKSCFALVVQPTGSQRLVF